MEWPQRQDYSMSTIEHIYQLHQLLQDRRTATSLRDICQHLNCSQSTAKRAIKTLRYRLFAPLDYDRQRLGYHYNPEEPTFSLPGMCFNENELFALLFSQHLLKNIQPGGLLTEQIQPIRTKIEQLLLHSELGSNEILKRIKILPITQRTTVLKYFRLISSSLIQRRQLRILYHSRSSDKTTERVVSAQRLIYYRDNWYLDAWCHLRKELRTFSVDRIHPRKLLEELTVKVDEKKLDQYLSTSYGIFAGKATKTAKLKFSPKAAKWVSDELWHPDQIIKTRKDGSLELLIPYNDPTELIRDILKYGEDVNVISPESLINKVKERLIRAYQAYEN